MKMPPWCIGWMYQFVPKPTQNPQNPEHRQFRTYTQKLFTELWKCNQCRICNLGDKKGGKKHYSSDAIIILVSSPVEGATPTGSDAGSAEAEQIMNLEPEVGVIYRRIATDIAQTAMSKIILIRPLVLFHGHVSLMSPSF